MRSFLKAAGTGAGIGGALGTTAAIIGSRVMGAPKRDEGAAYAKRGAVGGAIGGALAGGLGVLALRKAGGAPTRALVKASKVFHPARWISRSIRSSNVTKTRRSAGVSFGRRRSSTEALK